MTQAMNEFLCALREAGSPSWSGSVGDRTLLVNAAAQMIEELHRPECRGDVERWISAAENFVARAEIAWRPAEKVN
jgi:hypothetical protein